MYCWFTKKELIEDHKKLKQQIKTREKQLDTIVIKLLQETNAKDIYDIQEEIDNISQEMMSINM